VITNSQSSILSQSVFTLFNYDNGDKSKIKFNVTNAVDDSNIEGAIITITGSNNFALTTDSDGIAYNVFKNGEYNYTITKGGYATKSGNFNVSNLNNTINIKLYNKYKVEWSISNGSIAGLSIGDSTVTHGEKYEFHIISDEGKNMVLPKIMVAGKALLVTDFTFDMDTGEGFIPADKVTGNIYLSSILANKEYKITATAGLNGKVAIGENSNSTGTVYQNNVEYGSNSSLIKFTADDGYEINKVYVDGEEKTVNDNAIEYSYVFANVTKDSTIEATFKEFTGVATFKVTDFNNDLPISGASINIEIFNSGENMVLTSDGDGNASVSTLKNGSYKYIITKNGYATKKGQFSIYNGNTDINVKLDTKYSLNWFIKNGTIDGNDINQSGKISLLEDYTFTIKANDGYDSKYFSANDQNPKERPSIYIDDVDVTDNAFYTFDPVTGIGTLDKSIITGDVSINAVFSKVKYDVRLKAGSNGKIKVGNETPVKGELSEKVESGNMTRMYEFIADSGYEIESVKVNGVAQSIDNDITSYLYMGTNINENKNIEVTFKTLTYTVEGLIDYVKQSIHDNTNKGTIKFKRAGLTDVQATFLQHKKQGKFTAELVPGTYTLEVLKDGYTKYEITGIKITNEPITLPQTIKLIAGDATWDKELISLLDVSTIVSGVRNKSITRADIDEDSYNSVIDVGYAKSNYSKTNILVTWEDFIK